jgi:hypothetical protein
VHGLSWDPGLLTLSTTRGRLDAESIPSLTQPVADGLSIAAAPPAPDQVGAALERLGDRGAAELAAAPLVRAFVDCGRLTASSPAMVLARRAALTILVTRPRLDEIYALMPAVTELNEAGCNLGLVCVGEDAYHPAEIASAARIDLLGVIPEDRRAAAAFDDDGMAAGRAFRRSRLVAALTELVGVVRSRCADSLRPRAVPAMPDADHELGGPRPRPQPVRAPSVPDYELELALPVSLAVKAARAAEARDAGARSATLEPAAEPQARSRWRRSDRSYDVG